MKTVMKKMFCLMLVAVLMVGVMPFQASAAQIDRTWELTIGAGEHSVDALCAQHYTGNSTNYYIHRTAPTAEDYFAHTTFDGVDGGTYTLIVTIAGCSSCSGNIDEHAAGCPVNTCATCGKAKHSGLCEGQCGTCLKLNGHETTCSVAYYTECCGSLKTNGHASTCNFGCEEHKDCTWDYAHLPTCKSLLNCSYCNGKGHTIDDGTCPDLYCGCGAKKADKLHPASCTLIFDCCGGNEAAGTHAADCPTYQACCGAAKPGHTGTCAQFYACCGAAKTGSHAATCTQFYSCCGAAKTGNHVAGCTTQKCTEPGCNSYNGHPGLHNIPCTIPGCTKLKNHDGEHTVACSTANCALNLGHAGDHKCACGLYLQKSTQHSTGCPYYENPANNAVLYVWAKLYTGDVKTGTVLLDTITGLSGNDLVYQVVSNNEGRIRSKIPAGYGWTGHVYYEQDPKTVLDVHSNLTVGAEDDVVLNLYSDQKLVVARVHTGKTYAIDRSINIDGFKIGNTVTSNDVLKAVQKYYNVSTMKMYTPAEWEKVVSGKTGAVIPNYEVHAGDNIIDVYVTGSHKTTSGTTHKADSSNPKTGDEIFVPTTVLFASVSSLAVLLYLNKKRAF